MVFPLISPKLLPLVPHPRYPRQHTTYFTHAGAPSRRHVFLARCALNPRQHVTLDGTSPTLARHQGKHTPHASSSPTEAHYPRKPRKHKQYVISQTPPYPIKLLKLLAPKFQKKICQFLLLVLIFTTFTFQAFLSIFIKLCHRKLSQENYKLFSKDVYLFKNKCAIFLEKNCFLTRSLQMTRYITNAHLNSASEVLRF